MTKRSLTVDAVKGAWATTGAIIDTDRGLGVRGIVNGGESL